jgi:hypothetical protein
MAGMAYQSLPPEIDFFQDTDAKPQPQSYLPTRFSSFRGGNILTVKNVTIGRIGMVGTQANMAED